MAPETAYFNRSYGFPYDEDAVALAVSNGYTEYADTDSVESTFDADELTVHYDADNAVAFEQQLLRQGIAQAHEQGDYMGMGDMCEEYLEHLLAAEHELESTNPKFSEVVEMWIEDETNAREIGSDALLEKAELYKELHAELKSEYDDAVKSGDIAATAEWDAISKIVGTRIEEYTIRDMLAYSKDKLALAA